MTALNYCGEQSQATDYLLDNFRETFNINHTAWVVSTNWGPPMFDANWLLRVGEGEMGGFTKDRLYALRNFDQPSDGTPTPTPTPSPSPGEALPRPEFFIA